MSSVLSALENGEHQVPISARLIFDTGLALLTITAITRRLPSARAVTPARIGTPRASSASAKLDRRTDTRVGMPPERPSRSKKSTPSLKWSPTF